MEWDIIRWGIIIGILYPIGMSVYLLKEWNKLNKGNDE